MCHFFFFNDTATTEIYTLSLHDALPICNGSAGLAKRATSRSCFPRRFRTRSEEHTSELQSQSNLVCRLLLEKKKIRDRTTSLCYRFRAPRLLPLSTTSLSAAPPCLVLLY